MIRCVRSDDSRIPPGSMIMEIDGNEINDFLEFRFYNDTTRTRRILVQKDGARQEVVFKPDEEITITLEEPVYRTCTNDCDFCFINGLPKGLRKELYFRDDDYRLSFLFGNFLSLTNVTPHDIKRIGRLRLSPIYVSVHTTEPHARSTLFKNEHATQIMEQLTSLTDNNITIHCQVVIIPGVSDGPRLAKTIQNLATLYPGVQSIGVVPMGKSKYAHTLPDISRAVAEETITIAESAHRKFRKKFKKGFVYCSDEFYIRLQMPIPPTAYYDDFPQYENGIGMVRTFIDDMTNTGASTMKNGRFLFLTGMLAYPFVCQLRDRLLEQRDRHRCTIDVKAVPNTFLGDSVTASGLLSGSDFLKTLLLAEDHYDRIMLPPNCVNDAGEFLDSQKIDDERIMVAPRDIQELVTCLQ